MIEYAKKTGLNSMSEPRRLKSPDIKCDSHVIMIAVVSLQAISSKAVSTKTVQSFSFSFSLTLEIFVCQDSHRKLP